ncbi:MAG: T9SS type A sorting domain-containing protein [Candidatus Thermoplasmatota archaeon]|nr:T9SS type A sorting domain-containing protein [Candidatus Thermoplasmatota archaeon]
MKTRSVTMAILLIAVMPYLLYSQNSSKTISNQDIRINLDDPGPWINKGLSKYQFDSIFEDSNTVRMPHGIAVDRENHIWIGCYWIGTEGIIIKKSNGTHTSFSPLSEVTVNNTVINLTEGGCRGMAVGKDGHILYVKASQLIKINYINGEGISQWEHPNNLTMTNPGIDGEGNIYLGSVGGVNPIYVLDAMTLVTKKIITIPKAPAYSRGIAVSEDAMTLWVGDLGESGGPLYRYTSTDFINYVISDSIYANTDGEQIFTTQRVTVNYGPDQRLWVSHDNSYSLKYDPVNALIIFDLSKSEYVTLPMPYLGEGIGNGPRNVAFSTSGDTAYVPGFNSNTIMRFVKTPTEEINILSPNGGEAVGCNWTIYWTSSNTSGNVKIEYFCNNVWHTIVESTPDDGSFNWNIPCATVCSAKIKISDVANLGCWDMSDNYFSINCPCICSLTVTHPNGGEDIECSTTITWTSTVGAINVKLQYYCNDVWNTIVSSTPNVGSYLWNIPSGTVCSSKIKIIDVANTGCWDMSNDYFDINCVNPCKLGDVNNDGNLTPGDALCAFNIYLYGGTPQPGTSCDNECALYAADINCTPDGITPGDALYIFEGYLQGKTLPMDCKPTALPRGNDNLVLSITSVEGNPDEQVVFSIQLDQSINIGAFGFNLGYPSKLLEFVGIKEADITRDWDALDGHVNVDGVVTIGGYNTANDERHQSRNLIDVVFKVNKDADGIGELWLFNLTDDLAHAQSHPGRFGTSIEGIRRLGESDIPDSYNLEQNYPNPFNLETEIIYQLPEAGFVTITIYNSVGHKIRSLVNQHHSAGEYAAHWDGRNDNGIDIPSGVYIYHIKTSKFNDSKKMILIK